MHLDSLIKRDKIVVEKSKAAPQLRHRKVQRGTKRGNFDPKSFRPKRLNKFIAVAGSSVIILISILASLILAREGCLPRAQQFVPELFSYFHFYPFQFPHDISIVAQFLKMPSLRSNRWMVKLIQSWAAVLLSLLARRVDIICSSLPFWTFGRFWSFAPLPLHVKDETVTWTAAAMQGDEKCAFCSFGFLSRQRGMPFRLS